MNAYRKLEEKFRRLSALEEAAGVLHWDLSTMMPEGGRSARTEQLAAIGVTSHEMLTAPETAELLEAAESDALDGWRRANLAEMRRAHTHATALTPDLVEAMSRATSACEASWRQARPNADFKAVKSYLAEVLNLSRQAARAKAEKLGCNPYEALMDGFEPGLTQAVIDKVFDPYAALLPEFLGRVLDAQKSRPGPVRPSGPFPIDRQKALARRIMERLGFNFQHGRLDESLHPFCGGVPEDVRITTRYREDEFVMGLMGVIHETGHALYERQLPSEWRFQPVGRARGMAMHESQSLLMEMQAARSGAFCAYLSTLLNETFPGAEDAFAPDNLRRLYSRVEPGFIRVDADEVTYPAHVILRYRLEKAMIAGALEIADLPASWNAGLRELLGLDVPSDREGCLQDIHWFEGLFGYFPCYSLGAMMAAQIYAAATAQNPDIPSEISRGEFSTLRDWLGRNVHALASSRSTEEILIGATGNSLDAGNFTRHLEARYLA